MAPPTLSSVGSDRADSDPRRAGMPDLRGRIGSRSGILARLRSEPIRRIRTRVGLECPTDFGPIGSGGFGSASGSNARPTRTDWKIG